jgi:arylsulfatase
MGDETHPIPTQRGFDEFYGTLGGGGSYYQPPSLVRNDKVIKDKMPDGYYYTDAINDEACRMIENACANSDRSPFFLYVAHVAPHWPLHAPRGKSVGRFVELSFAEMTCALSTSVEHIEKYSGTYMKGWDIIRKERHQRLIDQKLISPDWPCSPRDEHSPSWNEVLDKEWEGAPMK